MINKEFIKVNLLKFINKKYLNFIYLLIQEFFFNFKFRLINIKSFFIINNKWLLDKYQNNNLFLNEKTEYLKSKKFTEFHNHLNQEVENIIKNNYKFLSSNYYCYSKKVNEDKINWFYDPIRNLSFDKKFFYKKFDYLKMRPQNFDIKYPWELSRLQHLTLLGQKYIISKEEKFLEIIISQIEDFIKSNPIGYTINWTCTMDVAIRAANIIVACNYILLSNRYKKRLIKIYRNLYLHGIFIFENLENNYEVTSNHYLSNLVGLLYLSNLFKNKSFGKKWENFCVSELESEINKQINQDGSDYESSLPYHKLVTELFLSAYRLSLNSNFKFSNHFIKKLRKMVIFLSNTCSHSNNLPQVGDCDDGRFIIFDHLNKKNNLNCNYIFSLASEILAMNNLNHKVNEWELLNWGIDIDIKKNLSNFNYNKFELFYFEDAGIIIFKGLKDYLMILNGKVGTDGFGNHKHNDLLSFEYHYEDMPIFVDIGSYVYTSSNYKRNYFRSVKNHNTFSVDNKEPNELKKNYLFRLFERSKPLKNKVRLFKNNCYVLCSHSGYNSYLNTNKESVNRAFFYNSKKKELSIKDNINLNQFKSVFWNFNCHPNVKILDYKKGEILLSIKKYKFLLKYDSCLKVKVKNGFYSPGYGQKTPIKKIIFQYKFDINKPRSFYKFKLRPSN